MHNLITKFYLKVVGKFTFTLRITKFCMYFARENNNSLVKFS